MYFDSLRAEEAAYQRLGYKGNLYTIGAIKEEQVGTSIFVLHIIALPVDIRDWSKQGKSILHKGEPATKVYVIYFLEFKNKPGYYYKYKTATNNLPLVVTEKPDVLYKASGLTSDDAFDIISCFENISPVYNPDDLKLKLQAILDKK